VADDASDELCCQDDVVALDVISENLPRRVMPDHMSPEESKKGASINDCQGFSRAHNNFARFFIHDSLAALGSHLAAVLIHIT
jgi:hypothetical protein